MKTQLLQDLQESGSAPPVAGEAVPAAGPPRRKPIVLVDDARTPSIQPTQRPAPPADDARTPPDPPRRAAVWHGPAAQRVDAGTPGQRLAPRAAQRAPDVAARGTGVAIEAWAERTAQTGAGESRPAPAQQPRGAPGPERPTMDVAAFFGRDERRGGAHPTGHESAAPPHVVASGNSTPEHHVPPMPRPAPSGSTHDALADAAAVPRRPHLNDVPAGGAKHDHAAGAVPPSIVTPGTAEHAPVPVGPADGIAPGAAAHEHMPAPQRAAAPDVAGHDHRSAARPDDTTLLRTDVPAAERNATPAQVAAAPGVPAQQQGTSPLPPEARTAPVLAKGAAPFPAAADTPVPLWRRLWKRRIVAWSVAGGLAAGAGAGAGWLIAGSDDTGEPTVAKTAPSPRPRDAQTYAAPEPAAVVKAPPATPHPDTAPASAAPVAAHVDAVTPALPAEPVAKPPPAPAPDVAPAASRSVATVDLDPPKHAAHRATAARKRAAAKVRRAPVPETPPVMTEPSPRERREETLMQCRAHGYDERQCIRRGCAMTRYGFACRG